MFTPSCWLRPSGIVGHLPVPEGAAPDLLRASPFPGLFPTWQQTFAFDLTVNLTAEESAVSPVIFGPFIILEIAFRSGSAGGASQLLRLGVGDSGTLPTTYISSPSGVPGPLATDSARTVGTYYATNVLERHALNQEVRAGTSRLVWMVNNTTAGAVTVVGHVTIQHCAALHAPLQAPTY